MTAASNVSATKFRASIHTLRWGIYRSYVWAQPTFCAFADRIVVKAYPRSSIFFKCAALLKLKITKSSPDSLHYLPFEPINIESIDSLNESRMRLEIKEWHRCKCSDVSVVEFHKSDAGSLPRRMKIDSSPAILEITKPFLFRSLRKLLAFFQLDDAAVPWALWFSEQTREPKPEDCELPEQNILAAKPNTLGNYATRMRGIPLY